MSTKPTTLPRWADDQSDPDASITNPSSAKKDDGWLEGEEPPAEYFNWWMNLVYQWVLYVQEGLWASATTGAITINVDASDGTLTRTSGGSGSFLTDGFAEGQTITFGGFTTGLDLLTKVIATVTGTVITVTNNAGMVDESGGGNEVVTAHTVHVGDIDITGDLRTSADVEVSGDLSVDGIGLIAALLVTGTSTLQDHVTVSANKHVTISGTGRYKHGDIPMVISAAAFQPTTGAPGFSSSPEPAWTATGADTLYAAIPIPVGKRIKSISFANTRASGTLTFETYNHNVSTGALALIGASLAVSSGTSRVVSAVASVSGDADATFEANEGLTVVVMLGASGNAFHGMIITFDEP